MQFTLRPNSNDPSTLDLCLEGAYSKGAPKVMVLANIPKESFHFEPHCLIEDIEHDIEQKGYSEIRLERIPNYGERL